MQDGRGRDRRDLDDLDGEMVASKIRETWMVRHGSIFPFLILDVDNDDGSCAVSNDLESHGLVHAACASNDNGHLALELIVWRCGVCHFVLSLLKEKLGI